jgi:hypothetical protein
LSAREASPRGESFAHAPQAQSTRKIVTTAGRDDQHRESELQQLTQVTVDGAIAAKEQDDIGLIRSGRHPDAPVDRWSSRLVCLEGFEVSRRTSQPENGGRTHARLRVTESIGFAGPQALETLPDRPAAGAEPKRGFQL